MSKKEELKIPKKNYAFIDGSFNPDTKVYGCGGFLIDQHGKKHIIMASDNNPFTGKMRNVAGEILGASKAVELALSLGMRTLKLFYDYDGLEHWVTGVWKTNKKPTKLYKEYMNRAIRSGLKITFQHVRGHAGILENEEADAIARTAVGIAAKKGGCINENAFESIKEFFKEA